jgi:exodeoxyribonuclease VII small subunit
VSSLFGSNEEDERMDEPQPVPPGEPAPPAAPAGPPLIEGVDDGPVSGQRFEEAYRRLETLVGEMERGDLPLEELLGRFEEGVKLVKHCRGFLRQAQLRVEQYIEQRDGHWVLKDME